MAKKRSTNPETQLTRAFRALEQGQHRKALRHLEKLLPLTEDNPALGEQVHLAMADAHLTLRNLPQAIEHAETTLTFNAESDRACYLLGFAHSIKGDWPQAIQAMRRAVALDPAEAEYYRALGWALFNQDQSKEEGQTLLEQALNMAPTHIPILTDLAMLHSQAQRFDQALIFARRAAELAPSDPMARQVLAGVTHFKREFERLGGQPASKPAPKPSTEAEWRELIAVTPDFKQVMQLWFDLHPAKDLDEANTSLQQLNELWNSTPRPELGGRTPNEMMGRSGKKT